MLTPNQLAKSGTEHGEQVALFAYCAVAHMHGFVIADAWAIDGEQIADAKERYGSYPIPELKWMHAIPNGGTRGDDAKSRAIRGGQLKAEGVRVGVSDVCWPVRRGRFSGLYIEMKKLKGGVVSDEQKEFIEFVKSQGYAAGVCNGWLQAVWVIKQYWDEAL